MKTNFVSIVDITLIRWGDGLFDSFRLGADNCPVDIFVLSGDETTVFVWGGGGGGGCVGLGLGLGSSNL